MTSTGSVVLSTLEFDVVWESERLPNRHVALDVPSPGITHTERAALVGGAWESLEGRGLARSGRVVPELADRLAVLAHPAVSVDCWVWADRKISALAGAAGNDAMLAVVDRDEVWLIDTRASALAEAAVSVAGDMPAGGGRSVSLPTDELQQAAAEVGDDPELLITALARRGVPLSEAQTLAGMVSGMGTKGQFGAQRAGRQGPPERADRVIAFHDTPAGRYLHQIRPSTDGRRWSTITPADNQRLASCVWELLDEI
ncbi:ESX secretion-associated protein EspG [Goodfellowiella coeruleoviolacea]|uniref:EspG family protein n=1 Tax=Goodfellowiella coeruleoviolacea TaxID=334858 RepID=A0AAE3KGR4_9PSEU|nr:ESX secretion-associated protein EspG [Goodfellowiella coeruleoviolacea]MCP2166177.1 EspG family protein [Goodfellowiella coeruleoviolacea]